MPDLPELPVKYFKVAIGFIALVFVANVLLLDFFLVSQRNSLLDFQTRLTQLSDSFRILGGRLYTSTGQTPPTSQTGQTDLSQLNLVGNMACPASCVDLITLSTISGRLSTRDLVAPTFTPTTVTSSTKGEFFVPLGSGSISTTGTTWTDVLSAQASFDAGNYGSIKNAYFEAFLHTQAGEVHARLFDTTTPAIFWGSDLTTTANSSTFLSAPITLSSGQKTYRVQMYSTISTGFLDQARIRIVTQ